VPLRRALGYELDRAEQAFAPDVTDKWFALKSPFQAGEESLADGARILAEIIAFDNLDIG
jgi:hypothetical protein